MLEEKYNDNKNKGHLRTAKTLAPSYMYRRDGQYILAERAEKILTALYMVTDFIDDNDILKTQIRHQATLLLADLFNVVDALPQHKTSLFEQAVTSVEHVLSLLSVAHAVGNISEMNYKILVKEMRLLQSKIHQRVSENSLAEERDTSSMYQGDLQEYFNHSYEKAQEETTFAKDIKDNKKETSHKVVYTSPEKAKITTNKRIEKPKRGEGEGRRGLILGIIKEKKDVTMKDIATRITNCTEKTLQRDLASLIKEGRIEKKGKRRWSTYSYKNA